MGNAQPRRLKLQRTRSECGERLNSLMTIDEDAMIDWNELGYLAGRRRKQYNEQEKGVSYFFISIMIIEIRKHLHLFRRQTTYRCCCYMLIWGLECGAAMAQFSSIFTWIAADYSPSVIFTPKIFSVCQIHSSFHIFCNVFSKPRSTDLQIMI